MKLKLALGALLAAPALGGCTTDEIALFGTALSLYSDLEYLDGDCAFGLVPSGPRRSTTVIRRVLASMTRRSRTPLPS